MTYTDAQFAAALKAGRKTPVEVARYVGCSASTARRRLAKLPAPAPAPRLLLARIRALTAIGAAERLDLYAPAERVFLVATADNARRYVGEAA